MERLYAGDVEREPWDISSFFSHATQLAGSQFPDQGLNLACNSESAKSSPLDHQGTPSSLNFPVLRATFNSTLWSSSLSDSSLQSSVSPWVPAWVVADPVRTRNYLRRRLWRVPWTARRSNQSILKEISPKYSLEGLMLKLKLPTFWPPGAKNWLIWKDPDAGKDWRQEKGMTEDEMVGWHHRLNGHGFE